MSQPVKTKVPKQADATWMPVIMSVVVYPGIGQWMQRRQTAATVYIALFSAIALLFTWTLIVYCRQLIPILRDIISGVSDDAHTFPPLSALIRPFGVVMFIYFANVVDVLRGRMQIVRTSRTSEPQK